VNEPDSNYPREGRTAKSPVPIWVIVVLLVFVCPCGVMLYPIILAARPAAPRAGSISNLKQIALANTMYCAENDGYGPNPLTWTDDLLPQLHNRELFRSTHLEEGGEESGYAYYRPLFGLNQDLIENLNEVPVVFDSSDMRWNANGDLSLLPDPPRWDGKNLIAFLDGHVKAVEGTPEVEIKLP
jgi:hypothetical protein